MCGRYTIFTDADEAELFAILEAATAKYGENSFKTGEIFPSDRVPVLTEPFFRRPELLTWGFPGFGTKNRLIINARAESAASRPSFRSCLENGRCVIPSTGFYEWNKNKAKYLFSQNGSGLVYMAGLYRKFDGEGRFVILTAPANSSMISVHERMPVVLERQALRSWLCDREAAIKLLTHTPPELVSRAV